jgi:hypothetical protein
MNHIGAGMDRDKIKSMVLECLREAALEMDDARDLKIDGQLKLFGRDGLFDSLGLVSFLVDMEDKLADELDLDLSLSDEKALSAHSGPFRSADSFVDYIMGVIQADGE